MKTCKHRSKPSGDARAFRTTNRVSKRAFRALALRAGLAALVATIRSLSWPAISGERYAMKARP